VFENVKTVVEVFDIAEEFSDAAELCPALSSGVILASGGGSASLRRGRRGRQRLVRGVPLSVITWCFYMGKLGLATRGDCGSTPSIGIGELPLQSCTICL